MFCSFRFQRLALFLTQQGFAFPGCSRPVDFLLLQYGMTLLRGWAVLFVEPIPPLKASKLEKTHYDYRSKLDTGELKQRINSFPIPPQQILGEEGPITSATPFVKPPWERITRTSSLWLFGLLRLASERISTGVTNIPSHSGKQCKCHCAGTASLVSIQGACRQVKSET